MASTTPTHAVPFMEDHDPLADVAEHLQALAERVDALVTSTRALPKPKAGFTSTASTNASGICTINHNAGYTPVAAFASSDQGTGRVLMFQSATATTVSFLVRAAADNSLIANSSNVPVAWVVHPAP